MREFVMSAESSIQHKVIKYAVAHHFICLKLNIGSQRGWPDYLLIDPDGEHSYIEFKAPGQKPRPIQQYRLDLLSNRGIAVCVCDNEEVGYEFIDSMVSP